MMGSPGDSGGGGGGQKATFSGMTAMIGVVALIADIVSLAVPHWGYYSPNGQGYYTSGLPSQDNTGHFGPFQSCKYTAYYSYCGSNNRFQATTWLVVAGICTLLSLCFLLLFCLFAILHVAMQLQRREIMVKFKTAIFLKLLTAVLAVLATVLAVCLGAIQFSVGGRSDGLFYKMGICYYIQIILIFVTIFLAILSYLSYRKARRDPAPIVPKHQPPGVSYEVRNDNGVSMTSASGAPYTGHGHPRYPNQAQPQTPSYIHKNYIQQPNQPQQPQLQLNHHQLPSHQPQLPQLPINGAPGMGYTNNGFIPVSLSVPISTNQPMPQQAMPMQPIRPIQPGVPQATHLDLPAGQPISTQIVAPAPAPISQMPVNPAPVAGVSFQPGGRGGGGFKGVGHGGSMESLNSTNSSTLSNYSLGSTISTGSGHGPLRSSLKKPKNKDKQSIASDTSSKRVRLSLGSEQTSV